MSRKSIGRGAVAILTLLLVLACGCNRPSANDSTASTSQSSSSDSELGHLLALLDSPDDDLRTAVGTRLFMYPLEPDDRRYLPQMIELLKHEDTNINLLGLTLLQQLGQEAAPALPEIRKCMNSHDKLVRIGARQLVDELEGRPLPPREAGPAFEKQGRLPGGSFGTGGLIG